MRQSFVSVLLLTAVALSSSNILPMTAINQLQSESPIDSQQNDNMLSRRFNPRNVLEKIYYIAPIGALHRNRLLRQIANFNKNNNAEESINDIIKEEDNYDGEGFRQEQWHNYPRQLDRLHKPEIIFAPHKTEVKRMPETDDFDNSEGFESTAINEKLDDVSTNEFSLQNDDKHQIYDAVLADTNPLLIFKIHLAYLNNGMKQSTYESNESVNEDENLMFSNDINPKAKVKREDALAMDAASSENPSSPKSKRLFSLWSRLQTLSHKGHELPHRRHLAFYGFPDNDSGNAKLNSPQTRALVRPPGSPLRWG